MKPSINILIVDDEPKNLTVLETILNDPSYRVVRAESANQALLLLVAEEFALIILDVRMPGMTGFELAKVIKDRRKTARVPIIFLTAYFNEDQHVLTGYDTGAVDYLLKPVNPEVLRSKVAVFAELHRKNQEIEATNRNLVKEVAERKQAEEKLRQLNETLEQRVAERTEALRENDRRKDEFLATLAHELRNPLAPVRNAVHMLQMKGHATPNLQWIKDVISRQVQQMTRLIDDLMDVSRIQQGKIELRRSVVEIGRVVAVAVETSRPLIEQQAQELAIAMPTVSVVVDADEVRLAQVFMNLLTNSAKYSEKGGRIEFSVITEKKDLVVTVRDNGIGIPPARLGTIFEMFSQVEGTLSRSQGGLGIGLCLVKKFVEMHGGAILAKSEGIGKGSEFVVRLPIVVEHAVVGGSVSPENNGNPAPSLRILVVDDNRDAATSLALVLKSVGNQIRCAHDGEEAIRTAADFLPHVVLLDIGMPRMNGYEAARSIREKPWGKKMVMIAVTGCGQDEDRKRSEEAGFNGHIVKPVDPTAMIKLLTSLDATDASPFIESMNRGWELDHHHG